MHDKHPGMHIHRAIVTFSSTSSGEIQVKIPSILGNGISIAVSKIGRKATQSGTWTVPAVNDQVLVAVEDDRFSNVYIIYPQKSIS